MTIEFTIPGKVVSANHVTKHMAFIKNGVDATGQPKAKAMARSYKPKEAEDDTARIKSIAFAAKIQSGWRVPAMARITILAYNSGLDVDNIPKSILDAIKRGLLIVDDRKKHLESCFTKHAGDDHLGERYVVRVEAVHPGLPL
jgi:hypothetical protein